MTYPRSRYALSAKSFAFASLVDELDEFVSEVDGELRTVKADNALAKQLLKVRAALEAIEGAVSMAPKSEEKSNPKTTEEQS
jgi:hypothetical protein